MKKDSARWWVILATILIVYNVIVFAAPFPKNVVFFLSWFFTMLSIAAQVYVIRTAFFRGKDVRSKFYGFPIARLGAIYLIIQFVLGLVFMALELVIAVPVWLPLILYVVVMGVSVTGLVAADAVRDEVERQDVKLKKDVSCMRSLQSQAIALVQFAQDSQIQKALEEFADNLRYSDPVSSEAIGQIETELTNCVEEMQKAVMDSDWEDVCALLKRANNLLAERNRLCKLNKAAT